jgi:O-antigen/teichoic acid export membrane protein
VKLVARVAKNSGTVLLARLFLVFVRFASISLIAKTLGKDAFGAYSLVVASVGMVSLLVDFGMSRIAVRELSRRRADADGFFGALVLLRGALAVMTFLGIVGVSLAIPMDPALRQGLYVYALAEVLQLFSNGYFILFKAFERMEYEALMIFIDQGVYLGLLALLLGSGYGLLAVFSAHLIAVMVKLAAGSIVAYSKFVTLVLRVDLVLWGRVLRDSFPIGITSLLDNLSQRIDILILGLFRSRAEVGGFAGAYRLIDATLLVSVVLTNAIFPILSRLAAEGAASLRIPFEQALKLLVCLALPLAVVFVVIPQRIVTLVFDTSFSQSVVTLRLLGGLVVVLYACALLNSTLISLNRQGLYTVAATVALVINVALDFALIPRFGYVGACVAAIVAQVILFGMALAFVTRQVGAMALGRLFPQALLGAVAMGIVSYVLEAQWLPILLLGGGGTYVVILLLTRAFRVEDVAMIREAVQG